MAFKDSSELVRQIEQDVEQARRLYADE